MNGHTWAGTALLAACALFGAARAADMSGAAGMELNAAPGFFVLKGAVNTGVLVRDGQALLLDCCDSVTPERLAPLGAKGVEVILCTQYRRPNAAGAERFVCRGARLIVPETERALFEHAEDYWADWRNRWHLYHAEPGPQVIRGNVPVNRGVKEGDEVAWRGVTIRVLDTPGATGGSVSYVFDLDGKTFCFSGDALYGPGRIWDLCSLQKGFGQVGDYHGFLGRRAALVKSLHKLAACGAHELIPAHGEPIAEPAAAARLLEERLDALWRNYTGISALNFYFPGLFDDTKDEPGRIAPARTMAPPAWIRRVAYTSFAVVSDSGAAFLIDCGNDAVPAKLADWRKEGAITGVDACWVTHYHDDHVDALHHAGCPIYADEHLAEILEFPRRFWLPCISPCATPVARTTHDGESWTWHEFKMTAFHFPGQTLHHGGLLVEGHGAKAFFAGDSGAPTGLDDYTCGNRTFLGAGRGFRRCIAIWREHQPDCILNQHQDRAFAFTAGQLDQLDAVLEERERLIAGLVPWEDANFALDEGWLRTYPYEQDALPGASSAFEVQCTNHALTEGSLNVEPVPPDGWHWNRDTSACAVAVPPRTDGWTNPASPHPDGKARLVLDIPLDAKPGLYVIPVRVTWNGRYLGQFRHALVRVTG